MTDTTQANDKPKAEPSKPVRIDFDSARAAELLSIVQGIANVAPAFTNLLAEAMAELKEMNDKVREEADKAAAAKRQELADKGYPVGQPGMPVDPQSSPATQTAPVTTPAVLSAQTDKEKAEAAKAKADADAEAAKVTYTSDTNPAYPERKI